MYNWSVDEKKFNTVAELVRFLTIQPEVLLMKKREQGEATVITVKLDPHIHPARKIHLTHYIHDNLGTDLKISVRETKTWQLYPIGS